MSLVLRDRFGVDKPVIAMVHLPGLPGRPRHDRTGGMQGIVDRAAHDVVALQAAGVDGLLFCNEADLPYQLAVGPEIPAAMASVVGQLRSVIDRPFGIDVVWDPVASLAAARATGATFIREVVSGVAESDHGIMSPDLGGIAAYREQIGAADVAIFGNITPEFGSALGTRSIAERATSAEFLGLDVILISGQITGTPLDLDDLRSAKAAVIATPVVANTGVRDDTVAEILSIADGVLVGTALKVDGVTWNEVDPERARRFMEAARGRATRVATDGSRPGVVL